MAEGGQPRDESLLVTHLGGDHQGTQGHQVQLGLPDIVIYLCIWIGVSRSSEGRKKIQSLES